MKYLGPPQSGSLSADVFSRNNAGQYARARTAPSQPSSVWAVLRRASLAAAVSAWNGLTDAQRQSWSVAIAARQDSLGQAVGMSGRSAFLSQYLVLDMGGQTPLVVPGAAQPLRLRSVSLFVTGSPVATGIGAVVMKAAGDAWCAIYAMPPVAPGVLRPPGRSYWLLIGFFAVNATSNGLSVGFNYSARFGSLPASGRRLWVQFREVTTAGVLGSVWRATLVWP